jgi:hypothetical protein
MDSEVIKNSFGQLESELETAREAANQIEQDNLHEAISEGTAGRRNLVSVERPYHSEPRDAAPVGCVVAVLLSA